MMKARPAPRAYTSACCRTFLALISDPICGDADRLSGDDDRGSTLGLLSYTLEPLFDLVCKRRGTCAGPGRHGVRVLFLLRAVLDHRTLAWQEPARRRDHAGWCGTF
jgi:hypothetical protein